MDLTKIKSQMKDSPVFIDGRVTIDPETIIQHGFVYRGIGRGQYIE